MFEEGNIIYFTPFYFSNGKSAPKPKYCIVLKSVDGKTILASLPTRKDSVPSNVTITDGCIELPDINLNCFVFSASTAVTESGNKFDFPTFVYGHQVDFHPVALFKELYQIEGTDYEIWGKLKHHLYIDLVNCLKNSRTVKQKFIKHL